MNVFLDRVYGNFQDHVKKYRNTKIKEEDYQKVFTANVFTGEEAQKIGLVDELGTLPEVMQKLYPKAKVENFS